MSHSETSKQIAAYLCRFANLRLSEIEAFVAKGRPRTLQAGESFCHLGQDQHEVAVTSWKLILLFAEQLRLQLQLVLVLHGAQGCLAAQG